MPRTKTHVTPTTSDDPLMGSIDTPATTPTTTATPTVTVSTATATQPEVKLKSSHKAASPLDMLLNYTGSKVLTITPALADFVLKNCNTLNRPLNKKRVTYLANAIKNGEWQINGEPIIFSTTQRLLDGQYRLSAIVEAGKEIETYVTTGISDEAFVTIDTGKSRTGSHVLSIKHTKHSFAVAATLNKVNRYYNRNYDFDGAYVLSNRQLVTLLEKFPDVSSSVEVFSKYPRGISKSTAAFCHFVLSKLDATLANTIFEQLKLDQPTIPMIATLHKTIIKDRRTKHRMKQTVVIGTIFKAWNAMRANDANADITVHATDEFPIPR